MHSDADAFTTPPRDEQENTVTAYQLYPDNDIPLIPAPIDRPWMDNTQSRFAYRCLPLTLANQAGWLVCCAASFCARWNGGPRIEDTTLVFDQSPHDERISSLFGHGVVIVRFMERFGYLPEMDSNLRLGG